MKVVPIPQSVMDESAKIRKKMKHENAPWWFKWVLPKQGILARSTGGGTIKPGVTVYLIDGHDRLVWPDGAPAQGLKIHEYVGLTDTGWQPLVQLGRDVEMV